MTESFTKTENKQKSVVLLEYQEKEYGLLVLQQKITKELLEIRLIKIW